MVATSTPKTKSPTASPSSHPTLPLSHFPPHSLPLVQRLIADYPQFHFKIGPKFAYHPPRTIILGPSQPHFALLTLHELGHAVSRHRTYHTHVERLKIETEAWAAAKTLYFHYCNHSSLLSHISWDEDFIQDQLDTYRTWLHQKSLCPHCQLTRYQTPDGVYHCPFCDV